MLRLCKSLRHQAQTPFVRDAQSQGMQMNQAVTFLSDGGDTVRDLQMYLNPQAEHLLDWFHISMRLTVMSQLAKSIETDDQPNLSAEIEKNSNASNGIFGMGMFTKRYKSWKTWKSLWTSKRIVKSNENC